MDSYAEQRPPPAAALTAVALLNTAKKGEIAVPGPNAESMAQTLARLPLSLRPIVSKVFSLHRSRGGGRTMTISEFKSIYEKLTAAPQLMVRAVETVRKPHTRSLSMRLAGDSSPTRSVLTTAPSLRSPKTAFSFKPFPSSPAANSKARAKVPSVSYSQQHQRKLSYEQVQTERDYETVQALTRNLNQSFSSFISSQLRMTAAEKAREDLIRVRQRHLRWSQSTS